MSPENFRPEAGQPTLEEAEKKRKRLDLYKKTLLADDYDTAESLDLSSLEPAERQKARDEVFAQKIDNLRVSWSADLVAKHIRKLQEKLGVSDEVTVAVVRQYCISAHAQPIEITSKGNRGIETRFRVTSEIQKITRQELPALFGIEFSDAEMRGYREDGFLEYIDERNFDLLRSGEQVKEALGVFGLDEGIVNSQRMKELLVRRIASPTASAFLESGVFRAPASSGTRRARNSLLKVTSSSTGSWTTGTGPFSPPRNCVGPRSRPRLTLGFPTPSANCRPSRRNR